MLTGGRPEIISEIPTLDERQFLPGRPRGLVGRYYPLSIYEPYIINISGPRGACKSGTLSWLAMVFLAHGLKVWLNYPLKFYLVRNAQKELLEASTLDFNELFTLSDKFQGGLIGIDEYNDWDNNYNFNSQQSKILYGMWGQIRKQDISFYYVSKFIENIGRKTRDETDIEIACVDAAKTSFGWGKYRRGERAFWNITDLSGNWTGRPWMKYKDKPFTRGFYHRAIWGAYDTRLRFDIFEAMRGLKVNLKKRLIGDDEDEENQFNWDEIRARARTLFGKTPRMQAASLWNGMGIGSGGGNNMMKSEITRYLQAEMGVRRTVSGGLTWFTVPEGIAVG